VSLQKRVGSLIEKRIRAQEEDFPAFAHAAQELGMFLLKNVVLLKGREHVPDDEWT
jgi:hypothetical protein